MIAPTPVHNEKHPTFGIRKYLRDFFDLVVRRKWLILGFLFLGIVFGGLLAVLKEDVYRSEVILMVEPPEINDRSRGFSRIERLVEEWVETTSNRVFSRKNLQLVIDEFQLYPDMLKGRGYEFVIDYLRKSIWMDSKKNGGIIEAISVSFAHSDPVMAMRVTEKLAEGYIEDSSPGSSRNPDRKSDRLSRDLVRVKEELDQKAEELSAYQSRFSDMLLSKLDENLKARDQLVSEQLRGQKAMGPLRTQLEQVTQSIQDREGRLEELTLARGLDAEKQSMVNSRLSALKEELRYKSDELPEIHPEIIALTMQIKLLEQEVRDQSPMENEAQAAGLVAELASLKNVRNEVNRELDDLSKRLDQVTKKIKNIERHIEQTPHRQQEFLELERAFGDLQVEYTRLTQRLIDARISENLDARNQTVTFRILDAAALPSKPDGIYGGWFVVEGLGFGAVVGVGFAWLLDLIFPTFRRAEDAEISLGLQTLAVIPGFHMAYGKSLKLLTGPGETGAFNEEPGKFEQGRSGYSELETSGRHPLYGRTPDAHAFPHQLNLVVKWRPQSIVAEQFRVAATRLDLLAEGESTSIVLVTSAKKGEGKTCTSANLAYTLARDLEEPTLVIDCDYKCPNLHNVFAARSAPGIAEFLAGQESLEACQQQVANLSLWYMTAGNLDQNPVPLSKMQRLSSMLTAIKHRYRFIILDGPPILPLADINVLSGFASIVLMVVRFGSTPKDVVHKAVEMIHHPGPIRLVLTDAWNQGIPSYVHQGYTLPNLIGSGN
jgi:polysaccharide biosynthesis transport protein